MISIVGISGSLRRASYNTALLRAAVEVAPEGCAIEIASIRDFPLYDGDLEAERGVPEAVNAVKERIHAADGVLIATPEYNGSIPGVLKNALDWMTRPPADVARILRGKPVAMIGATTGGLGTALAQTAMLSMFRNLGLAPFFGGRVYVSSAREAFDGDGRLVSERARETLEGFVVGFARFCEEAR